MNYTSIGVVMLFNAISAHQKKIAAEAEAAEAEREAAKEERRRVNATKLAEARGKLSEPGQQKNFLEALAEKRKVGRHQSVHCFSTPRVLAALTRLTLGLHKTTSLFFLFAHSGVARLQGWHRSWEGREREWCWCWR